MSNFLFSINAVAPLFILMALGYVAKQINFVSDTFLSETNKFVFRFSLPLMLFQNIQSNFHGGFSSSRLIYAALGGVFSIIILAILIVPFFIKKRGQQGSLIQGIYRSNFIIYGIPLATSMYGKAALLPITMLLTVIIPVYNISAVCILSFFSEDRTDKLSLKKLLIDILKNPLVIGCLAGLLVGFCGINFPSYVNKPMTELAGIATPLALFVMGGQFKFKELSGNLWKVFFATIARLLIVPFMTTLVFIYMGFRGIELCALLCLFATPTAVVSYIMAENMGCDGELSAQIVVATTLFSCFTIFLFVYVLKSMGYL